MASGSEWVERPPASIVPIAQAAALFQSEICRLLFEGYASQFAAAGNAVPAKSAFDLYELRKTLPDAVLCAITVPDRCVYRVAGERLKARLGFNPTGQDYYQFVPEIRRRYARWAMNMVVATPCGFRAEIEQSYSSGEVALIEVAAVPLLSDEPGVDGFILFADCALTRWQRYDNTSVTLQDANVVRRDLIDLGFGVDTDFRDLVPVGARGPGAGSAQRDLTLAAGTIRHAFADGPKLSTFEVEGRATIDEVIRVMNLHFADRQARHVLWDLTKADLSAWDKAGVSRVAEAGRALLPGRDPDGRTAIVVQMDVERTFMKIYTIMTELYGSPIRYQIFADRREALAWLDDEGVEKD